MSSEAAARLENWSLAYANSLRKEQKPDLSLLFAEPRQFVLRGTVYGHPQFEDGTTIETNLLDGKIGESIVTGSGTTYQLGQSAVEQKQTINDIYAALPELHKPLAPYTPFQPDTQDYG